MKALIDCTGQIQDFEANAALAAYDAKGNRVNVTLSPETVHASVKLAKIHHQTRRIQSNG